MATPTIFLDLLYAKVRLQGEAAVEGFEDQIVIDSIRWNVTATPTNDDKMNTTWNPRSVTLSKVFDRASTALYTKMKDRKMFDEAMITVLDLNRLTGKSVPMMVLRLRSGHVASVHTRTSNSRLSMRISEELTLSFTQGKLSYFPAASNGGRGAATDFLMVGTQDWN